MPIKPMVPAMSRPLLSRLPLATRLTALYTLISATVLLGLGWAGWPQRPVATSSHEGARSRRYPSERPQ